MIDKDRTTIECERCLILEAQIARQNELITSMMIKLAEQQVRDRKIGTKTYDTIRIRKK